MSGSGLVLVPILTFLLPVNPWWLAAASPGGPSRWFLLREVPVAVVWVAVPCLLPLAPGCILQIPLFRATPWVVGWEAACFGLPSPGALPAGPLHPSAEMLLSAVAVRVSG